MSCSRLRVDMESAYPEDWIARVLRFSEWTLEEKPIIAKVAASVRYSGILEAIATQDCRVDLIVAYAILLALSEDHECIAVFARSDSLAYELISQIRARLQSGSISGFEVDVAAEHDKSKIRFMSGANVIGAGILRSNSIHHRPTFAIVVDPFWPESTSHDISVREDRIHYLRYLSARQEPCRVLVIHSRTEESSDEFWYR